MAPPFLPGTGELWNWSNSGPIRNKEEPLLEYDGSTPSDLDGSAEDTSTGEKWLAFFRNGPWLNTQMKF